MQTVEIHINPNNFPCTRAKIQELIDTIGDEAISHVEAHGMPSFAAVSIVNALLHQMIGVLSKQQVEVQGIAKGRIEEVHAIIDENGTITPVATGPEMTPIQKPNLN